MAEVIDITKYIKKNQERELDDLSLKLERLIDELGISTIPELYVDESNDYIYGLPYIYTAYPQHYIKQAESLSDITDILTRLAIQLDELGHRCWADQLSNVVGEMFVSGTFKEG